MPTKPSSPCSYPGCPNLAYKRGYCEEHFKQKRREYDSKRLSSSERGYTWEWAKYRKSYLISHPLCVECEKQGRTTAANVVDHIIPHKGDQALFWDPNNHQALCDDCHNKKSAAEDGRQFGQGVSGGYSLQVPEIIIVCGPPGSGKTSYVMAHKHYDDIIVDLDLIFEAFTGLPYYNKPVSILTFILSIRDFVMRSLTVPTVVKRAWIIIGAPKAEDRDELSVKYHNAKVVLLFISPSECMARIYKDTRRSKNTAAWQSPVDSWHSRYTPREGDIIIR